MIDLKVTLNASGPHNNRISTEGANFFDIINTVTGIVLSGFWIPVHVQPNELQLIEAASCDSLLNYPGFQPSQSLRNLLSGA